jgi:hypothetical protein
MDARKTVTTTLSVNTRGTLRLPGAPRSEGGRTLVPEMSMLARSRIVLIVMENQSYSDIIGSAEAPYINSLVQKGELFTDYSSVEPGSVHDYLAMTSGLTYLASPTQANIFQAIDDSHGSVSWVSLQESMGGNCGQASSANVPGTSERLYKQGHDPAYQYRANESCAGNDIPMTTSSFDPAKLPSFTFVTPNMCDDMHTLPGDGDACPAFFGANSGRTAVQMGDNWLSRVVPMLLSQDDTTVVLTWDERGHIVTLEVGAGVSPGTTDARPFNHYSLEAGLYSALGLGTAPNNGSRAAPLPVP